MSLFQRLGIVVGLFGILANVLARALSPLWPGLKFIFILGALIQVLAVIGYLLVAKRGMLGLIFIWLGVGSLVLSGFLGDPVRYVFLVLVVLALWTATGTTVNSPMPYSRYQRLGIVISLLGILANIFWLAVGPAMWGVIVFVAGALMQALGITGYRLAAKKSRPGLILVWLGVWALTFSGLISFFGVGGLIFLILLALALAAATGTTAHYSMSFTKKMAISGIGVSGIFLLFYLMLFGAIIPTIFMLLAAVGVLLLIALMIGIIFLRVDWMRRLAILGGILGGTILAVYALSFLYPRPYSAPAGEVFTNPQAIDIDHSGNLFVLDEPKESTVRDEQARIFKFAPNGRLLATWSNRELLEKMDERKISLTDISVGTSGQIYLLSRNDWIWKVDKATTEGKAFSQNLVSLAVDAEGKVIVVTADMDVAVARGWRLAPLFNFQEALLQVQKKASPKKPAISFAVGKGKKRFIYIVDQKKDHLLVYDEQGILALSLKSGTPKFGDFRELRGIAANKQGNIFVSEAGNHRIIRLSSKGTIRTQWGRRGKGVGEFGSSGPGDIAIDEQGQVYVVDSSNRRIQKFSSNGKFIFEIKGSKSQANRRN